MTNKPKVLTKEMQQLDFYRGKLKEMNPNDWTEYLTAVIVDMIDLNLQQMPEPGTVDKMAQKLYKLLAINWPGATKNQVYRTLHRGYTKQGSYGNFRVTYPLLANWILYQKDQSTNNSMTKDELEKTFPLHEQAQEILAGLAEYRKRVDSGEYVPKGRKEAKDGGDSS